MIWLNHDGVAVSRFGAGGVLPLETLVELRRQRPWCAQHGTEHDCACDASGLDGRGRQGLGCPPRDEGDCRSDAECRREQDSERSTS